MSSTVWEVNRLKRVLVTGASGFVGRNAIGKLIQRGFEVHAISRRLSHLPADAICHEVDIFNSEQLKNALEEIRPSHLLHFAWNVDPQSGYMSHMDNFRWVRSSLELLEIFQKNGGVRVVFAGTCFEYDLTYGYLSEEITPCKPSSNYGLCKNSLYEMMRAFCFTSELSSAWGRMFFIYGPHEYESRLVSSVTKSLLSGKIANCTLGEQYRDFLHVEDVADAFCALLDSSITGAVNIGSGMPIKIRDLVQLIATQIGRTDLLRMGALESRIGEPELICANINRLTQELCWKPCYTIEKGIEKNISWWRKHLG